MAVARDGGAAGEPKATSVVARRVGDGAEAGASSSSGSDGDLKEKS